MLEMNHALEQTRRLREGRKSDCALCLGFTQVGHHLLPVFPLETLCSRICPPTLSEAMLFPAQVLAGLGVRSEGSGVRRHTLDGGSITLKYM